MVPAPSAFSLIDWNKVISGGFMNPLYLGILVNKAHPLPADYIPEDLVPADVPFAYIGDDLRNYLRVPAARALEIMFQDAGDAGMDLTAVSGYRSFQRQKIIYENNIAVKGLEHTSLYSAEAGCSEHQTGLAMDISTPSIHSGLTTDFEATPEGLWLREKAPDYGFILRYPAGKEHITGYAYEPWHFRYIGRIPARYMTRHRFTLEEYYRLLFPKEIVYDIR